MPKPESFFQTVGLINFVTNPTGKRNAGNPPVAFDVAGAGNRAGYGY